MVPKLIHRRWTGESTWIPFGDFRPGLDYENHIRAADLHHTSDYTPYEGLDVTGAIRDVFVRGAAVVRSGTFAGRRGHGRYVERTEISG